MQADATPVRQALARSIGLAAFVYGHPLIESMRSCAKQTGAVAAGGGGAACAPIDAPLHWAGPTQAEDRDVLTPANDLLYTTAWINLAAGPRWLTVPAAALQPQRYFVLALDDAYTENFHNLGPRNCLADGERVLLVGPDEPMPLPTDTHVVRAPTNLVWVLARLLVEGEADLPLAKQLQACVAIEPLAGSGPARPPLAVQLWSGPAVDVIAAMLAFDGHQAYTLRFAAGAMPPAGAFWSVTLYDADRFLYPNARRRHAIGDRSKGLQHDADGGLTLHIAHAEPADTANWLPAPAGRFYLILRLYHPGEDARGWQIPAVASVNSAACTTGALQ